MMAVQFAVLASGSRGNASFIRAGSAGLLIDLGIGVRDLSRRLESVGAGWEAISAAVLTHTHGDHVDDSALRRLAHLGIPFYCHDGHRSALSRLGGFLELEAGQLVRTYDERPFLAPGGIAIEPLPAQHDGGPTYGFRVEARPGRGARPVAIGYLADSGCWSARLVDQLVDVDVLGIEFNHDVDLQRRSRRHPALIARNLGDWGHLSNDQGSALVAAILGQSNRRAVRHLVLLHLSEQCNRPDLALAVARAAVRQAGRRIGVHAAQQAPAHPNLWVNPRRPQAPRGASTSSRAGQRKAAASAGAAATALWLFQD